MNDVRELASLPRLRDYTTLRVFSSSTDEKRARRPTDVVLFVVSLVGIAALATLSAPEDLGRSLSTFLSSLPGLFNWVWALSYDLLLGWVIVLVLAAILARGRGTLVRDQILALAVAASTIAWIGSIQGSGANVLVTGLDTSPPLAFPAVRLALAIAAITVASPHLGRPIRYAGRWILMLGAIATLTLGISAPLAILSSACIGFGAASLIHLVFGSPGGRPTFDQIRVSLAEFGFAVTSIEASRLTSRGIAMVDATTGDGRTLLVKVHGRDAWEGQAIAVLGTRLWYRGDAPDVALDPRGQVVQEGYLTLLAERAGVPVQRALAAGMTSSGDAVVVLEQRGTALADLDASAFGDPVLDAAWRSVTALHEAGMAHGRLNCSVLFLREDGSVALGDFAAASHGVPEERFHRDAAQLLISTALRVGPERARAAAHAALGDDGLASVLPFLQPAVLTPQDRQTLRAEQGLLEELRTATAEAATVEIPKLAPIRRITWGWALKVALILGVCYFLMQSLTGMDFASVSQAIAEADQGWIWLGLAIGILATAGQALSTMGAATVPLSFPVSFALQLAIQFIAVLVPSSAARVALNVRFFQKMGQTVTTATMIGALDAVSGFAIQVILILTILLSGMASLDLGLGQPTGDTPQSRADWLLIAMLLVMIVAAVILAAIKIPRARDFVAAKFEDVKTVARNLRSPGKTFELFVGNFLGQMLLAVALGLCLRAFGEQASFAQLILINTFVSLFSGLMPVPGGMGVTEAALTTGLVAIGIPQNIAVSTAIVYRVVTFYLPPAWAWIGMRWLRTHDYV